MNEPSDIGSRATASVGDVSVAPRVCVEKWVGSRKEPGCGRLLSLGSFGRWGCVHCSRKCGKCGAADFECCC